MPRAIPRVPADPLVAAVHESGHAVARLAHGVPFQYVEICEDGTGAVQIGDYREGDFLAAATRCLAGPVAEARFADRPLAEIFAGTGRQDFEQAREIAGRGAFPIRRAVREAQSLIADNWPAILAVAKALAARGCLTYEQAREIAGTDEIKNGRELLTLAPAGRGVSVAVPGRARLKGRRLEAALDPRGGFGGGNSLPTEEPENLPEVLDFNLRTPRLAGLDLFRASDRASRPRLPDTRTRDRAGQPID